MPLSFLYDKYNIWENLIFYDFLILYDFIIDLYDFIIDIINYFKFLKVIKLQLDVFVKLLLDNMQLLELEINSLKIFGCFTLKSLIVLIIINIV